MSPGVTQPERTVTQRPGLQAERTDLSWTRTGLAFLVNGGLLLMRHGMPESTLLGVGAVTVAFVLAAFTLVMARHRKAVLAQRPLPEDLAARWPLLFLGVGTTVLNLIVLVVVLAP